MQHLHSYKIRMLFPKGPFHTFSLPKLKEILQGVEKKITCKNIKHLEAKLDRNAFMHYFCNC